MAFNIFSAIQLFWISSAFKYSQLASSSSNLGDFSKSGIAPLCHQTTAWGLIMVSVENAMATNRRNKL